MARRTANDAIVSDDGWWYWVWYRWRPLIPKPPTHAPRSWSREREDVSRLAVGLQPHELRANGEALVRLIAEGPLSLEEAERQAVEEIEAGQRAADRLVRLADPDQPETASPDDRIIEEAVLLGQWGTALRTGAPCRLGCDTRGLVASSGEAVVDLPYSEVRAMVIGEPREVREGGKFAADGFGSGGAVGGLVPARVLSALMSSTEPVSLVRIGTDRSELVLLVRDFTPAELRGFLRPILRRIEEAGGAAPSEATDEVPGVGTRTSAPVRRPSARSMP